MKQKNILMVLFFITFYVCAQKKLVVFVTGYNNVLWVKKTLDSIFSQRYQNFRLLYFDDASTDGAVDVVCDYIKENNISDRVTFIANKTRQRKLANLYRGFYLCDDDEIIVFVDGDDWLVHDRVFEKIVSEYKDPNVWMTYGSYCNKPKIEADKWGVSRNGSCNYVPENIIKKRSYRKHTFVFMHLRTCYGWLLKQIKLQDLIARNVSGFVGDFYPASNDLATFFPIVEMVHTHVRYIPDLLYVRNLYSDIVGFKVDRKPQVSSAFEIRKKKKYPICKKPIVRNLEQYKLCKADLLLHITNDSVDIEQSITDIQTYVKNYEHIFVLYNRSCVAKKYVRKFANKKQKIIPVGYCSSIKNSYKSALQIISSHTKNNYFLCMNATHSLKSYVDCAEHIYWLERTFANVTTPEDVFLQRKIKLADDVWACIIDKHCTQRFTFPVLQKKRDMCVYDRAEKLCLYIYK